MTEHWKNDPKMQWWSGHSLDLNYGTREKIQRLKVDFERLDVNGALGTKMLELGSGRDSPLNYLLDFSIPDRTLLGVDVIAVSRPGNASPLLQYDIRELGKPWTHATKRAIVEAARKLDIQAPLPKEPQLDTIFFFEILNYVDYQNIISTYSRFLKPGGRIVILNNPQRRPPDYMVENLSSPEKDTKLMSDGRLLFDERGAKSNVELERFVREHFAVEPGYPKYPWGLEEPVDSTPGEDLTFMFLVARKR